MATIRNLAVGTRKIVGADNSAKTTRAIRHEPERALAILGITNNPDTPGTRSSPARSRLPFETHHSRSERQQLLKLPGTD
ncbi:hypothetical protein QQM39_25925 [Streptomyces sp. DT2A-34]|uniref:hypothetical protein n=1 Tax=Streptomyces sp. DT2A-34 TaxID=3051182 RepID=UPI00265C787B|nr:hypothetical protein [Streptomyces sp. DT2A-34]MDO0914145.1 hypothetical protein [Streptomyces sp. DT2A-34]